MRKRNVHDRLQTLVIDTASLSSSGVQFPVQTVFPDRRHDRRQSQRQFISQSESRVRFAGSVALLGVLGFVLTPTAPAVTFALWGLAVAWAVARAVRN